MGALTPGPEDAKKQEDGADDLANPTHGLKTIPAAVAVAETIMRLKSACRGFGLDPPHSAPLFGAQPGSVGPGHRSHFSAATCHMADTSIRSM
jgi:hypothetical protein